MKRKSALKFCNELLVFIDKETTEFEVVEQDGKLIAHCECPSEWLGKAQSFSSTVARLKEKFEFSLSDNTELVFLHFKDNRLYFEIAK